MKTMDNPHERENEVALAYLAGLVDGEGMITIQRTGNRRLNGVMGLQPCVSIANTNEAIIQRAMDIIESVGVRAYIKTSKRPKAWKQCYWIIVSGLTKTAKLLHAIKPYLVGKLSQAQLVLEFVDYRGNSNAAKGKPYGPVELGILDKVRALNSRGSSEIEDHKQTRQQAIAK